MGYQAWIYLWIVLLLALGKIGVALAAPAANFGQWPMFAVLLLLTTGCQFWSAEAPNRQSYYPHLVFFSAGMLVFSPTLFIPLVILPHLVEWAKKRWEGSPLLRHWYIQPFNMATHILSGAAAHGVQTFFTSWVNLSSSPLSMVAAVTAVLTYVLSNHLLIGQALVSARGISWKESRVLDSDSLLTDFVMMLLGYALVLLWQQDPWLILLALSPLVLVYQALKVPELERKAQVDPKTGLLNAGQWQRQFQRELERAQHFKHPLSLIMVDLDGLRNINNTHGHLAGDTVLTGIAQILHRNVREYDIVGRFGGEEFAVALPESGIDKAKAVAEHLRQAVETASFGRPSLSITLRATASFGVTAFPDHGDTIDQLIHQADVALYQAKARGKNRVISTADLPHLPQMSVPSNTSPYKAAFAINAQETIKD